MKMVHTRAAVAFFNWGETSDREDCKQSLSIVRGCCCHSTQQCPLVLSTLLFYLGKISYEITNICFRLHPHGQNSDYAYTNYLITIY